MKQENLKPIEPKWHRQGVFICRECGIKNSGDQRPDPVLAAAAHDLRKWLKLQLALRFQWGKTRVMMTSCMDICPKWKILVTITGTNEKTVCYAIDPTQDRCHLLEKLVGSKSERESV